MIENVKGEKERIKIEKMLCELLINCLALSFRQKKTKKLSALCEIQV
jgi:hypothetical protein